MSNIYIYLWPCILLMYYDGDIAMVDVLVLEAGLRYGAPGNILKGTLKNIF